MFPPGKLTKIDGGNPGIAKSNVGSFSGSMPGNASGKCFPENPVNIVGLRGWSETGCDLVRETPDTIR